MHNRWKESKMIVHKKPIFNWISTENYVNEKLDKTFHSICGIIILVYYSKYLQYSNIYMKIILAVTDNP